MPQQLILVINPGNTSTKVAVYDGTTPVCVGVDQARRRRTGTFRRHQCPEGFPREPDLRFSAKTRRSIPGRITAIAARGGLLKPLASGTYIVDRNMIADLVAARQGSHASNLAAQIGYSIAARLGITCYIVDPVSVDEAEPLARYSGHRQFTRVMLTHALNMKAVAKRFCAEKKLRYDEITLLVIHLGTGNSISLHHNGRMVDAVNPSEEGAFSMDRSGGLPLLQVARYICEHNLKFKEFEKMVFGNGGLFSYLGSKDFLKVRDNYLAGDALTVEVVQAMAYQVAKEAGALATVVGGQGGCHPHHRRHRVQRVFHRHDPPAHRIHRPGPCLSRGRRNAGAGGRGQPGFIRQRKG